MRQNGHTATEYALLLGLVAILCVASLQYLGDATAGNLNLDMAGNPRIAKLTGILSPQSGDSAGLVPGMESRGNTLPEMKGSGYLQVFINSKTNMPALFTTSSPGGESNATSVDGAHWNVLGQFQLAQTLDELAAAQSDPEVSAYIMELAKKAYYLGGAEGELDGIPGLELGDSYGKIEAFRDLERFQGDIKTLLENPPGRIDRSTLIQVNALAADVYNIAQTYNNSLSPLLANQDQDYVFPWGVGSLGAGKPGAVMELDLSQAQVYDSLPDSVIEDVFTYDSLKLAAKEVLVSNNASVPVKVTLTNATSLDEKEYQRAQ